MIDATKVPYSLITDFISIFFIFLRKKKEDARVAVIVSRLTIYLGKSMGTTNSNRNSETLNSHIP